MALVAFAARARTSGALAAGRPFSQSRNRFARSLRARLVAGDRAALAALARTASRNSGSDFSRRFMLAETFARFSSVFGRQWMQRPDLFRRSRMFGQSAQVRRALTRIPPQPRRPRRCQTSTRRSAARDGRRDSRRAGRSRASFACHVLQLGDHALGVLPGRSFVFVAPLAIGHAVGDIGAEG